MELKEFIKNTIVRIAERVQEGHKYIVEKKFGDGIDNRMLNKVDFDVSLVVNEEEKTGIGGKIQVAGILGFGGSGEVSNNQSNVTRIQFHISFSLKTGYGDKNPIAF